MTVAADRWHRRSDRRVGGRGRPIPRVLPAALVLAACADAGPAPRADGGGWAGTVDTLPSGRIVVTNPDEPLWAPGEEWTLREAFRLGSLEGAGADVFGQIRDLEIGPSGELWVLDSQADEIRAFGPDGTYVRTFGRAGQGPGELTRPAGMTPGPDGMLWVMNWGNARYTAYDPATGELAVERRRLAGFTMIPWPGAFDREGRLVDMGNSGRRDDGTVLLRLDTAFVPTDTLPMPEPDDGHRVMFRRDGRLAMMMMDPFAPQPAWAPRPAGGIVVGGGAVYRLHRIGFDADTTMTIEIRRQPIPVTDVERDSALAAFRERARQEGGLTADREPRVVETKPVHGRILVDDADRTWVQRAVERGANPAWDVIDRDGRFLGTVSIPLRSTFTSPVVRGDRMAVATEVDGVPTVVVYDVVAGDNSER